MEKRYSYLLDRLAGMPYAAPFSFQKNTTVGIGGEAPLALYPESEDRLTAVLGVLSETHIPYVMLGRGSNVLVSDSGFSGVVVSTSRVGLIRTRGEILYAECQAERFGRDILSLRHSCFGRRGALYERRRKKRLYR